MFFRQLLECPACLVAQGDYTLHVSLLCPERRESNTDEVKHENMTKCKLHIILIVHTQLLRKFRIENENIGLVSQPLMH